MNVPLRPFVPETDTNFIVNSWLSSWVDHNTDPQSGRQYSPGSWFRRAKGDSFFEVHRPVVVGLLSRCPAITVAHAPDEPNIIMGWIVADIRPDSVPVVHYCYVKHLFRKQGIAKALLQSALFQLNPAHLSEDPVAYTHQNEAAKSLSKRINLVFDPMSVMK